MSKQGIRWKIPEFFNTIALVGGVCPVPGCGHTQALLASIDALPSSNKLACPKHKSRPVSPTVQVIVLCRVCGWGCQANGLMRGVPSLKPECHDHVAECHPELATCHCHARQDVDKMIAELLEIKENLSWS